MYSVSDETRKPIFEGVQGENESRGIQFDISSWIEELGEGVCTATAKRPTDTTPYPVTVTRSGNVVTWKPNSTDTSIEGVGAFQLAFSINDVVAKTRIWNTKIAPSLVGAGDPPDPYDDWIQDLRDIAAETITYSQNAENSAENAEAWAVGQRGGVDVPSTDPTYENNAKYYAEQSAANQYGAYIVKSASGDIASFNDGADNIPMKSLKVAIVPKQAGSGDPSPDNVRPITGWTTVNVIVSPTTTASDGTTTPVPLGQTVYGGTLDVGTGELTITQVAVDAGALSWTTRYTGSTKKTIAVSVGASNKYNPQSQLDFVGACGVYIGYVAGSSILNNPDDRATGFYTYRGSNDTPEDSLYMVLPVNDTPSGLVVFNKYTPTTVQLTPTQVASLLGTNNVWADCGSVEVEYRADPTLAYNELANVIVSLGGNI